MSRGFRIGFNIFSRLVESDCVLQKPVTEEPSGSVPALLAENETLGNANNEHAIEEKTERPLKALKDISWPPEPDASIFMDPLKKDDPKPLRREELMRIGMLVRPRI